MGEEGHTLFSNLSHQNPSELAADSDPFHSPEKENPAPSYQYKLSASSQTLTNPPLQGLSELSADSDKKVLQADEKVVPFHRYTPPTQGPSELSADNEKNLLQGKGNLALHTQSTVSSTSETLNSPSPQELIDLGMNSGRNISLEKMLRLRDQEVLETLGPKDNNLGFQICSKGGCIIPEIVAAVGDFEPYVKDYNVIGDSSQISVSVLRSVHLYGVQAHCLTVPCLPGDTRFFEALYDFEARRLSDLSFRRGDIIRKDRQTYKHWAQGTLGKRTGLYPENHVRPCSFQSLQSCRLYNALRGQSLVNKVASRNLLICASSKLHFTKTSVHGTLIVCFQLSRTNL